MDKPLIIKTLLGDDISPFIASELKSSYKDLLSDLTENKSIPIFSDDPIEEKQQLLDMLAAFRLVHSWYSCTPIED